MWNHILQMYLKTPDNGRITSLTNFITNVEEMSLWCAVFKETHLQIFLRLLDQYRSIFYRNSVFHTDIFAQTPLNFFINEIGIHFT